MFPSAPTGGPRTAALLQGACAALALFAAGLFLLNRGAEMPRPLPDSRAAAGNPRPLRDSPATAPRRKLPGGRLHRYFHDMPVLRVLDRDGNLAISGAEMAAAPASLRALDRDRNGRLSPEECGFDAASRSAADPDPGFLARARLWFMRLHPVLAALDTDGDGEISPAELATAAASLRALDWDHDGQLTDDELLPDPVANALAVYMVRWDTDGDGRLSPAERAAMPKAPREVAAAASTAAASAAELRNEIRRRAITDGDGGAHQLEIATAAK